ncbi:MAG: NTP transferase domain-containing protein [Verrucomicrobiota bacterium]
MSKLRTADEKEARPLRDAAKLDPGKVTPPEVGSDRIEFRAENPVLVLLAAGKGTRFGQEPKCAQMVNGVPLARHSIDAFRSFSRSPVVCVVGYRHEQVAAALGNDNWYVQSSNPTGGTAFAVYEAFSVAELEEQNPIVIVTMGDRIVPTTIYQRLYETHLTAPREADLTLLTAIYEPPRHVGKGRIVRDSNRRVLGIIEQKDIDAIRDEKGRQSLNDLTEGNCPLYALRARPLRRHLEALSNRNAQGQYYLTDLIELIRRSGGDIRTITTTIADPEYALLCSDVTRPMDLALLEGVLRSAALPDGAGAVEQVAGKIRAERPLLQIASIAAQLEELLPAAARLGFKADEPVAIGISGGRLRIAFMHPDMGRFFGPAWQMPIGAGTPEGREQIVVLMQRSEDRRIHLAPTNPEFQEKVCSIPADIDCMYPGAEVGDWYSYEGFGTRMAENLLLSLGYFTDEELQRRRDRKQPLPPASLWVSTSMRRPFSLVGNAIASMRTVRTGSLGVRVQAALGRETFAGLRIVSGGDIPRGGFSSSSAVTVATKNAINSLFDLSIPPDMLVHLSCQAEYGTGVRAGSLDQATEQKGRAGQGTLISSNPRDNYRILGTFPVPAQRFHVIFPYSVDRDREAWRWSAGAYAAEAGGEGQTTSEMRKMTGKSAELAALLLSLPLNQDFFQSLEADFLAHGRLGDEKRRWVCDQLKALPLLIAQDDLRARLEARRGWYVGQLQEVEKLSAEAAGQKAETTFASLFAGWRDPWLWRMTETGAVARERGVPLRAMVAYLFGEVAKNFYLIHHPLEWIEWVSRSQWGDRCVHIDPDVLPTAPEMMAGLGWEKGLAGPLLMERWLDQFKAQPFDFNQGLSDQSLSSSTPPELHLLTGTNFFRGLALIDLVEAMLKRAFGQSAVAVRVNAAGQGDFFQVHVDSHQTSVGAVKQFLRVAFYQRFGLGPSEEFVEPHPGGEAVGVRLERFGQLRDLVRALGRVPLG